MRMHAKVTRAGTAERAATIRTCTGAIVPKGTLEHVARQVSKDKRGSFRLRCLFTYELRCLVNLWLFTVEKGRFSS